MNFYISRLKEHMTERNPFAIMCFFSLISFASFEEVGKNIHRKSVFTSSAEKKTIFFFLLSKYKFFRYTCWLFGGFHFNTFYLVYFIRPPDRPPVCYLFVYICLLCVWYFLLAIFSLIVTIFPVDRFHCTIIITNKFVTCLISSVFDWNQSFARNQKENPLTW